MNAREGNAEVPNVGITAPFITHDSLSKILRAGRTPSQIQGGREVGKIRGKGKISHSLKTPLIVSEVPHRRGGSPNNGRGKIANKKARRNAR